MELGMSQVERRREYVIDSEIIGVAFANLCDALRRCRRN
jgi:hypothetical protein